MASLTDENKFVSEHVIPPDSIGYSRTGTGTFTCIGGNTETNTETGFRYSVVIAGRSTYDLPPSHAFLKDGEYDVITATGERTRYVRIEELEQLKQEVASLRQQVSQLQSSQQCCRPHIRQKEMI